MNCYTKDDGMEVWASVNSSMFTACEVRTFTLELIEYNPKTLEK